MMVLMVRYIDDANSGKVRDLIRTTVEKIAAEGLDRDALAASLNRVEFKLRNLEEPVGLERLFQSLGTWLYGGDPMDGMLIDDTFAKVRAMADNGGFEALLRELFLDDTGLAVIHTLPSHTLGQEQREAEAKRVKAEVDAMTPEQVEELKKANAALVAWQQKPDRPEDTATLPVLPLSEVGPDPVWVETQETEQDGVKVLYHPVPSQGIVHLALYFPLTAFDQDDLPRLSLMSNLLGELPTKNKTAAELQQAIKTYIGSLTFRAETFGQTGQTKAAKPCLSVYASVLEQNLPAAQELLAEILTETDFDQPERIKEILAQEDEKNHQRIIGAGHVIGILVAASHYSAGRAAQERMSGYTYMSAVHALAKDFDAQAADLTAFLTKAAQALVNKASLTASVTADAPADLTALLGKLPAGTAAPDQAGYSSDLPQRVGIPIPAQISFAVKGYHLDKAGTAYDGSLAVLHSILSLSYLWSEVRVQGGAYGCGFRAQRTGSVSFHSFRDPTPARSLGVYDRASAFVKEYCDGDEDLTKFIISTIGESEPLQSPADQGQSADIYWFSGLTRDDLKVTRAQMLATTRQSLLDWRPMLDKMAQEGAVCVVGHQAALDACGGLELRSF